MQRDTPAGGRDGVSWIDTTWILRIAAAMCFIGHGAFGIITKKAWVPYFGVAKIPEPWAWKLMPVVGAMDIACGICALVYPGRWLWLWMAIWAVWTALLRPFAGEPFWEAVERAGNFCVPLTLLALSLGWARQNAAQVLRYGAALLLLGHGMLAFIGKAGLVAHWHAMFPAADAAVLTRVAGGVELAMAFFIAVEPTVTLCFAACAWKMATEALFFAAGAPAWEFIERAGSYGAPLVLGIWLAHQRFAPASRLRTVPGT